MRGQKRRGILLFIIMSFAVVGIGCKKAEEQKSTDTIHWWVHYGMKEENGVDLWKAEYERMTGIHLNLEIVSNNKYDTLLELAFSSRTVPEVFDLCAEKKLAYYAEQGAIADLTELVKGSSFYDKVDPAIWQANEVNGRIYGVPMEVASGAVSYIREDWLNRLGLEVPKNYEEFIQVLRQFRDNIEECKVPLTAPGLSNNQNLPEFYQGASSDFVRVNGVWVDGFAQDSMAAALHRMQDAYAEGLLDMEVVTNTTTNCRDQWYSGSVGVFSYWGGNWGQTLKERLQINVPEAEVLAMDPIEGAVYYYSVPSLLCISSHVSKEKQKLIFDNIFEKMHDGGEGQVLFESGVEGVHWEQDGEYIRQLPTIDNPEEDFRKAWITPWMSITPLYVTDKKIELDKTVTYTLNLLEKYGEHKIGFPVSETLNRIVTELTSIREEILAKVVMGDMTVEEGMAIYKKEAAELGVEKVLEEMNGN